MKKLFLIAVLVSQCVSAQPPLTSNSRESPSFRHPEPVIYPGRAPIYVAPHIDVYSALVTNVRPLVVEVTIVSNVEQRILWYQAGVPLTNYSILATSIVSRTTNTL